jgi:hypothetical protein
LRLLKRSFAVVLLLWLTALAGASAASAQGDLQPLVMNLSQPAPLAGFDNDVAWSTRDPATGLFKLVLLRGRNFHELPVAGRAVPFDVDVGPGPDGHIWVVYSRCTTEPPLPNFGGLGTLPDYTQASGCGLYGWNVSEGTEHQFAVGREAVLPSIWHGRIAYVRLAGGRALPRIQPLTGGRSVSGGRGNGTPNWLDLSSSRLAISWRGAGRSELRIGKRIVARTHGDVRLLGEGFDRGALYFRTTCVGSRSTCPEAYWAYRPRSRTRYFALQSADVAAAAHAGGNTLALLGADNESAIGCNDSQQCRLVFEVQLEFSRVPS